MIVICMEFKTRKAEATWALAKSGPGSRGIPGLVSIGPAKFHGAELWQEGAYAETSFGPKQLIGAYTGEVTISAKPRSKFFVDPKSDPRFVLHAPLKERRKFARGNKRTCTHMYVDATDPAKSGWCRYINTHTGQTQLITNVF